MTNWLNNKDKFDVDLKSELEAIVFEKYNVCEWCLENMIIYEQIEITGGRIGWYEHPAKLTWMHEGCDSCEKMVEKTFQI